MRVTRETQAKTRARILKAGRALFSKEGLEGTTTRALATRARIATGTLFNYFPTKEALAAAIVTEDLEQAGEEFESRSCVGDGLEETLFAQVAVQLRHLAPHRRWLADVLETGTSLLRLDGGGEGTALRVRQLERVQQLLTESQSSRDAAERAITLHLYWSLYLGVLDFWSRDDSHNQEATLALLDRSMNLFCKSLDEEAGGKR